jgi:uncharacterized membrane protein YfcA
MGQLVKNSFRFDATLALPLAVAALCGSFIGADLGSMKFSPTDLRKVTAVLILIVSVNVLWKCV